MECTAECFHNKHADFITLGSEGLFCSSSTSFPGLIQVLEAKVGVIHASTEGDECFALLQTQEGMRQGVFVIFGNTLCVARHCLEHRTTSNTFHWAKWKKYLLKKQVLWPSIHNRLATFVTCILPLKGSDIESQTVLKLSMILLGLPHPFRLSNILFWFFMYLSFTAGQKNASHP